MIICSCSNLNDKKIIEKAKESTSIKETLHKLNFNFNCFTCKYELVNLIKKNLKLTELTISNIINNPSYRHFDSHLELVPYLTKLGFKHTFGGNSFVFTKNEKDYVIKIYYDKDYDAWLNFCEKYPSEHFIKVLKKPITLKNNKFTKIIVLEKLQTASTNLEKSDFYNCLYGYFYYNKFNMNNVSLEEYNNYMNKNNYSYEDVIKKLKEMKLYDLCLKFNELKAHRIDLHGGNIMIRNNTYVITDLLG